MPGLIAFGRKWGIGSDDFVLPGILEIFVRMIWLIFMSVVYNLHKDAFARCTGGDNLQMYCIGVLSIMCLCIVMSAIIVFVSSRGSIMNTLPRRKFVKILYIRTLLATVEIGWNIVGTYLVFGKATACERSVEVAVKVTVVLFWVLAVAVFIAFLFVFGLLGGSKKSSQQEGLYSQENGASSAKSKWEKRFRFFCCCLTGNEKNMSAFNDISKMLEEFFKDVDLVPTDIAAGLILVNRDQEKHISEPPCISYDTFTNGATNGSTSRTNSQPGTSIARDSIQPKSWMTTDLMFHYMKYANSCYGWPFYMFTHLCTGLCHLCKYMRCCSCCLAGNQVYYDNCCQCNTATIRRITGLDEFDLVYADYHNSIFEIPFYVAIDKEKQSVVVAIRGTLSLKDAVTDLSADCESLICEGFEGCVAHKGILQAAQYVKKTLEEKQLLDTAFERAQGSKLVITGHSLGAGAAALLAVLLKPMYPDLICFAFAPPGGLMSYEASLASREYICSVVLGRDVITRLSIWTMYDLKEKTLTAIRNTHSPKFRILASGIWEVIYGCCSSDVTPTERLINRSGGTIANNELEEAISNVSMAREQLKISYPPMYPPGQLLHVLEVEGQRVCCGTPTYYAEWSKAEDFVKEIILSPDMITDHVPDNLMTALEQLSQKNFTPRKRHSQEDISAL